jgi:hypothetical protein
MLRAAKPPSVRLRNSDCHANGHPIGSWVDLVAYCSVALATLALAGEAR